MHIQVHDYLGLILAIAMVVVGFGSFIDTYLKNRPKVNYLFSVCYIIIGVGAASDAIGMKLLTSISRGALVMCAVMMVAHLSFSEVKRALAGEKERGAI